MFRTIFHILLAFTLSCILTACGGGEDSSTTTVKCNNPNCQVLSPSVSTPFVQTANNLRVSVDNAGPQGFTTNTNLLFADVKVCAPGGAPNQCVTIDHVLVDTGSVGLRVLSSKVKSLALPDIPVGNGATAGNAWECFPFVIGGLWGKLAAADVYLGQQGTMQPVAMQLIDDLNELAPTGDCQTVTNNSLLTTASSIGANGILGIGNTTLDCGIYCQSGTYHTTAASPPGSSVLYYSCPAGATNSATCGLTPIQAALQAYNPVAALAAPYNNGVVLKMPAIPANQPGAATALGELILGIDMANLPGRQVFLGVANPSSDSYLSVTTQFNGHSFANSYLDTGTNGMFFYDQSLSTGACSSTTAGFYWYCPNGTKSNLSATISDGDNPAMNQVPVSFQVANFIVLSSTQNTAFSDAAGAVNAQDSAGNYIPDTRTFAWGMPFFYGKQVAMSIWQQAGSLNGPWVAWSPI
jgi:Protein of unknown function (DUF3443)